MSKEVILQNILATAKATAEKIVSEAEQNRDGQIALAEKAAAERLAAAQEEAREKAELNAARKRKIAELDAKKLTLGARRATIERAYALAAEKLTALPDEEYRKFIGGLIVKYAEPNDTVLVSERDEKRLTADWLSKIGKGLKLSLAVSQEFTGGVILRNTFCDKNLTVEMLVAEVRPVTEAQVAALTEA